MDALKDAYKKRGSGRLFWCGRGQNIPAEVQELIQLARASGRQAFYVPTEGFDNLVLAMAGLLTKAKPEMREKYEKTPWAIDP